MILRPGVTVVFEIMAPELHIAPSQDALIKAARSLDQSSAESTPDTLANLWMLLTNSISGPFHASEELILRWLLKNMNGAADSTERFRRYPMVWRIMACLFSRIPLIALAKSLADRRFIPILQQTLQEISKPNRDAEFSASIQVSDTEMPDAESAPAAERKIPKKRKRSPGLTFDLDTLRSAQGCLRAAEAVFDALRTLIARLEQVEMGSTSHVLMGTEHLKSLFCTPSKDAVELLRPILSICDLVLQEQEPETLDNQASWVAVFAAIWNFHLQSSGDALEVAMSLYPTGCVVLARMDRSKDLVLDPNVKAAWTRDLRYFFIKTMILPARAAFLNRQDISIIQTAVDVTNYIPTASYPVLFSLSVKTPHSTEDAGAKKDQEDWTGRVFDVIEEPMRAADPMKRNQAMKVALDTALHNKASISLASLRAVCRHHTTTEGKMDLELVARVANLDVDAFLISNEGHALLDEILGQVTDLTNSEYQALTDTSPIDFVLSLAKGFARGRNLSGFIGKWYDALAECLDKGDKYAQIAGVWSGSTLIETVSDLLQTSINTRQLLALLDRFEDQGASLRPGPMLVVLEALSQGMNAEDFVDAASMRLFDIVSKIKLRSLDDSMKARWWRIVEDTVSRATLDEVGLIWTKVESDLKKTLKKGETQNYESTAAFRCCSRFWLVNYPGGPHDAEACAVTCSYLKRLRKHEQQYPVGKGASQIDFQSALRLADMLSNSNTGVEHLQTMILQSVSADAHDGEAQCILPMFISDCHKSVNGVVEHVIEILIHERQKQSKKDTKRIAVAVQTLLEAPSEALTREHREQIMPKLLFFISDLQSKEVMEPVRLMKLLLSLMIKIMKRPTFYDGMKFADLVAVGDSVIALIQTHAAGATHSDLSSTYSALKLFEALASATLKQMASNLEKRERSYLTEAAASISSWEYDPEESNPHLQILSKTLIEALEFSKAKQQAEVVDLAAQRKDFTTRLIADLHLTKDADWLKKGTSTNFQLVIYEQLGGVDPVHVRNVLLRSKSEYMAFVEMLCKCGVRAGWRLKEMGYLCLGDEVTDPLTIPMDAIPRWSNSDNNAIPFCLRADADDVERYIDVVLSNMKAETRNSYLEGMCRRLRNDGDVTGDLLALHRMVRADSEPSLRLSLDKIDLSEVHSILAKRLTHSQSSSEFTLTAQSMQLLLDKKPSAMKQWNTEVTLSTVSNVIASSQTPLTSSTKFYETLTRLVEVLIKRHRLRLEGHFHLLITTLQSLLRHLLLKSPDPSNAKLFARLLTLICEPSAASVTRGSNQQQQLDSATDAAKRSAGQHMYLVLATYIRLQLECTVPIGVREALAPGVYSVLDITTQEGRRILNEAVDGSGRAIFREMYRRYVKFGKWSGV